MPSLEKVSLPNVPKVLLHEKLQFYGVSKKLDEAISTSAYTGSLLKYATFFSIQDVWVTVEVKEDFWHWYDWFETQADESDLHHLNRAMTERMEREKASIQKWLKVTKKESQANKLKADKKNAK